jgi:hypothetical protein
MMPRAAWLRAHRMLFVSAAILIPCVGLPAWMLTDRNATRPAVGPAPRGIALVGAPALAPDRIMPRLLFGRAERGVPPEAMFADEATRDPAAPPELLGIAGRLPDDAVALVRDGTGRSRALALGEVASGWRLAALAADAVLFVKGSERVRVGLPAT